MKLLLIEDEEKLCHLLKEGLGKLGFAVEYETDGNKGLNKILSYPADYDCLILDNMLPNLTGSEILKSIRKEGIHLPILILTAKDSIEDKVKGLSLGADDYLIKPFDFSELVARINALLRRPASFIPNKIRIRDIEINTEQHIVKKKGKEVFFTLKEFRILEYLIRNTGQIVSKDRIIAHTTNEDTLSYSNVIEVHIKNIRKKLGFNNKPYIETIKNGGYRFVK